MDATPSSSSVPSASSAPSEPSDFDLSPSSAPTMASSARRWARRLERWCCTCAKYFPLVFVYGITTWAVYVLVTLCSTPSKVSWLGRSSDPPPQPFPVSC
jgi:hypothetical protein